MDTFNREELEFFLPDSFKGLSKAYIIDAIFNSKIQKNWKPQEGDVIVGCTGNVFVISGESNLVKELGGTLFFFGGHMCNRDGGIILNETACFTMNESGTWYTHTSEGIKPVWNNSHSSWKDFRFVPYPHELEQFNV